MPLYLTRFSYTAETWARLIGNPEDRQKAAREYIESVGGKLHGFWYAFGEHDAYNLWEAPDNVSAAAVALAITGAARSARWRDRHPDRRRDDGRPAQGRADRLPSARRVAAGTGSACEPGGDRRPPEEVAGVGGDTDVTGELDPLVGGDGRDQLAEVLEAQGRVDAAPAGRRPRVDGGAGSGRRGQVELNYPGVGAVVGPLEADRAEGAAA